MQIGAQRIPRVSFKSKAALTLQPVFYDKYASALVRAIYLSEYYLFFHILTSRHRRTSLIQLSLSAVTGTHDTVLDRPRPALSLQGDVSGAFLRISDIF